jgi:ribonuclease HII
VGNFVGRGRRSPSGALYAFDAAWIAERGGPLAGADEAGRGAFAGPLVAAAVVLGEVEVAGIDDSKVLRPALREKLYGEVLEGAQAISCVTFPAWWIDAYGVGAANKEALKRALESVRSHSGCYLADGNLKLGPEIECQPRADSSSAAVAVASVLAKVLRDGAMFALAKRYPNYGFERNKGYGTREHRASLREAGPCRTHRLSYAGVS